MELTAVIITFNEERNIARCIDSLRGVADEILVLDSGSTDSTEAICREKRVRFYQKDWQGYSGQKNFANQLAEYDWILSIDADEALSPVLAESILQIKTEKPQAVCSFNRCTNYCGTWIRHGGWYPDVKVRMFNRRQVKWEGEIHEQLTGYTMDEVVHLKGDLLHFSYYSIEDHYRQTEKFTTLSAEDLFKKGKKVSLIKQWFAPAARFISGYFFRLGFLDGKAGFSIARISAYATKKKYQKLNRLYSDEHA